MHPSAEILRLLAFGPSPFPSPPAPPPSPLPLVQYNDGVITSIYINIYICLYVHKNLSQTTREPPSILNFWEREKYIYIPSLHLWSTSSSSFRLISNAFKQKSSQTCLNSIRFFPPLAKVFCSFSSSIVHTLLFCIFPFYKYFPLPPNKLTLTESEKRQDSRPDRTRTLLASRLLWGGSESSLLAARRTFCPFSPSVCGHVCVCVKVDDEEEEEDD